MPRALCDAALDIRHVTSISRSTRQDHDRRCASLRGWVVYAKKPFGGPQAVLAYLSRYTHRIAISNSRLLFERSRRMVSGMDTKKDIFVLWEYLDLLEKEGEDLREQVDAIGSIRTPKA